MSEPTFIDTSFWLALVSKRDKFHEAALSAIQTTKPPFITSDAILLEVGNALSRPNQRHLAVDIIRRTKQDPNIEIVHISPKLLDSATDLFAERIDKGWGLVDCTSFVIMRECNIKQALTTDHHFIQAGFLQLISA